MDSIEQLYSDRISELKQLASTLTDETERVLSETKHVDRISFRAKDLSSFLGKIERRADPPYTHPLEEIEDQVGGRILVFFESDIPKIADKLKARYRAVESTRRFPESEREFDYESHHLIFTIPLELQSNTWCKMADPPKTFEVQIRTLFMHAWAEPQHDLNYKAVKPLDKMTRRELAWLAASAWGADQTLNRILEKINAPAKAARGARCE